MQVLSRQLKLPRYQRGFHLITQRLRDAMPEIATIEAGILHVFIRHSSASLTINENADPTVRRDFERFFSRVVPDGASYFEHLDEGPDDMPAHIKASLLGHSVSIPIVNGLLALGTWQGVYLGEHRNFGGERQLILTLTGR